MRLWVDGLKVVVCVASLAACDDAKPPSREQDTLVLPKGQSALDSLLAKPALPSVIVDASPDRLDFRSVPLGQSVADRVQFHNRSGHPVTLRSIGLPGASAGFSVSDDCAAGQQIAEDGHCTVSVTFRPLRPGPAEDALIVEVDGRPDSLRVPLSGLAVAAAPVPLAQPAPRPVSRPSAASESLSYARIRLGGDITVEGGTKKLLNERKVRDIDYSEAGLPGAVSTFPVNRARVITADRYIPAVLENSIDSQLPGRAIAVVERNVFGEDDRLILIPAGSRVIGRYQSLSKAGQARLDINWSRIIRPDGSSINIDFAAADVMGRAGVPGDLDDRLFEKYGSSLLISVIGAAGTWALGGDGTSVTGPLGTTQSLTSRGLAANRLGNDIDQLAQHVVQDNVDIRPVLIVPQGTRLVIIPAEDVWLRDPSRMQAVTAPKGRSLAMKSETLAQLLPALLELLAENPAVQKAMPTTAQQFLQSALLQQLQGDATSPGAAPINPIPGTPTTSPQTSGKVAPAGGGTDGAGP